MGAEWPAWDLAEAFDMWKTARFAYVQQYPGSELGDVLDVMKGHVDEQRRQARAGEAVRP